MIYASGANDQGQLGFATKNCQSINQFQRVQFDDGLAKFIACGWSHSVLLTEEGKVFVCGDNRKGQLGLGSSIESSNTFLPLESVGKVIQIACNFWSTFLLLDNGEVIFFGTFRPLKNQTEYSPTILDGITNVKKIAVGHKHFLTLSHSGEVNGFGCDKYGQIDFSEHNLDFVDIFAGWNHSVLLTSSNQLFLFGKNDHNQLAHFDESTRKNILNFEEENIKELSFGSDHGMVLTDERLLIWGWNEHGVLGQDHNLRLFGPPSELNFDLSQIKRIAAGVASCFILTK